MSLQITPLTETELTEATKLYKTSLQDNKKGFIQDINHRKNLEMMIRDFRANRGDIYILKKDTKVIGMGALKRVDDTTVELCKLHIYPHFKGEGFGKYMALELIKHAKQLGYSKVVLHVTKTQKEAIGLYNKLGFRVFKQKLCQIKRGDKILEFDTLYMERDVDYEDLIACA